MTAVGVGGFRDPSRRFRRVLGVNLLLMFVGMGITGIVGEVWLRRSFPFVANRIPWQFVPGVGVLLEPHEEMWHTNLRDYWTISRVNRLGFLDREPITPERAASSCHIALIGDSFVAAREVDWSDRVQIRLEALAARERPDLDLTTSAYGVSGTSQVHQIPLYDAFVRPLLPKVVVLVGTTNDFEGNSVLFEVKDGTPWASSYARAERGAADGRIGLRLPDGTSPVLRERIHLERRWGTGLRRVSFLWSRLEMSSFLGGVREQRVRRRRYERWRRRSGEAAALSGWRHPRTGWGPLVHYGLVEARRARTGAGVLAPAYAEALELTGFALDEFAARAARDGSHLVLFLNRFFGEVREYAMAALAEERGIPVVDMYRYITVMAEGNPDDAGFAHDGHWSPQGHRWAAEALWEYLEERPALCGPAEAGDPP